MIDPRIAHFISVIESNELTLNSVLILKADGMSAQLQDQLMPLVKKMPEGSILIVLKHTESFEHYSEHKMNAMGWWRGEKRIKPPLGLDEKGECLRCGKTPRYCRCKPDPQYTADEITELKRDPNKRAALKKVKNGEAEAVPK